MSRIHLLKGGALVVAVVLFLTVTFSLIDSSNTPSVDELKNDKNTDLKDTRGSPTSTEHNITTFSDGSSEKKTVFGNMPPIKETVYFKMPKEAANNVTNATMDVSGLIHNLRNAVNGGSNNEKFGFNVSCAGDVNNDGFDDVVIGAPGWDGNKGKVYVYYGSDSGISPTFDVITGGTAGDMFGHSVSGGCDVNNDSYADIVIGAPNWNADTGRVYVFHGSASGITAASASEADAMIDGEASDDKFGFSVSNAGNIDGDSYDDVVVGAPYNGETNKGRMYIFKGSAGGITATSASQAEIKHVGDANNENLGMCVSTAGDYNDDNFDDIIVGSPNWFGTNYKGRGNLYLGRASGTSLTRYTISGEDYSDHFGTSVSSAGDVNNDGYDDIIIGAPGAGSGNCGRVYLFLGKPVGSPPSDATDADTKIDGLYEDEAIGSAVSDGGDINNDSFDDIIIGSYNSSAYLGRIWVFYGNESGIDAVDVRNASTVIHGEGKEENFGYSVSSAGDVNKDGYIDIIIGAPYSNAEGTDHGAARIYFGSSSGASNMPATLIDSEIGENTEFGFSVSSAGDTDNDGFEEVIISAYKNNSYKGCIYIFKGSVIGTSSLMTIIECEDEEQHFGYSVAHANVNNDAYEDIIVGAPGNLTGEGGLPIGRVYIFHGSSAGITATLSSQADKIIVGENEDDKFGWSAASAGKVNNDNYADIIVGAPGWSTGGKPEAGQAYIFHGSSSGITQTLASAADTIINVGNKYSQFGYSVSSAGDVNNDGYDDVVVGEPYYPYDTYIGRAYVFHGSSTGMSSSPSTILNGENIDDNFGYSVSVAGNVNGDSWDDIVVGAPFYDTSNINAGKIYVYHGSSSGAQGTAAAAITGQTATEHFGISVSNAGNIDQDTYDDVIAGADGWPGDGCGKAYIFLGSGSGLITDADTEINGEYPGDKLGTCVAAAGDVNGDAYIDVVISAPSSDADSPPTKKGRVYIVYGGPSGLLWWDSDYIPRNPKVDVTANGTYEWTYSGYYTSTQAIEDFSDELNYYLATHQEDADLEGNILVPINVTCDSRGTIMLDNVHITWTSSGDLEVEPPTNIDAVLEGASFEHINITWTLSIDDGGGADDVAGYDIYYNQTYTKDDYNKSKTYTKIGAVDAGVSYFVHENDGLNTTNSYYYIVAKDGNGNTEATVDQAGKIAKGCVEGWNFISDPYLNLDGTDITEVLRTLEWDTARWYNATDAVDHWKCYASFKPSGFNDLNKMNRTMGIWVNVTIGGDHFVDAGRVYENTAIQLYKGWNLVSYASFINRNVENALSDIWSYVEQVEAFDESNAPYYLKTLSGTDWMEAGCGYWIGVSENCIWTIES